MFGRYFGAWFGGWFGDADSPPIGAVTKMRFKPLLHGKAVLRTWQ